jgi:DNA-binding response OmpR family regulator
MNAKPLILAVNSNQRNLDLLEQFLVKNGYAVVSASSLDEFSQALQGGESIRLALVDITGFDPRIWEQCKGLREKEIPFIIVSPRQISTVQQAEIPRGAQGVLVKPLATQELLGLMRGLLEQD